MAFNPMASFQKYKKIWMAAILLLCMATFVLCQGTGQGDLFDRLLGGRGRSGALMARVDGTKLYTSDLEDLRKQRNLAEKFMRKCADVTMAKMGDFLGNPDKLTKEGRERLFLFDRVRVELFDRIKRPRYFEGGVKYEDLIDFKVWLAEADRLGVILNDDAIRLMIQREMFFEVSGFDAQEMGIVQADLPNSESGPERVLAALRDEFRARIAQQCLQDVAGIGYYMRLQNELTFAKNQRLQAVARMKLYYPPDARIPLSPADVWDFYQENRSAFSVSLVPIDVALLQVKVPAPKETDLQSFFDAYKDKPYDPTSDKIGLKHPRRISVKMVMADPDSPYYKTLGKAVLGLETQAPLAFSPLLGGPLAILPTALTPVIQGAMVDEYVDTRFTRPNQQRFYATSFSERDLHSPLAAHFATRDPAGLSNLVGGTASLMSGTSCLDPLGAIAGFLALGSRDHKEEIQAGVKQLAEKRLATYLSFMSLSNSGWGAVAPVFYMDQGQKLPRGFYQKEIVAALERNRAAEAASANMQRVRRVLDDPDIIGAKGALEFHLAKLIDLYGLTTAATKQHYSAFDIAQAPELAALKKAYEKNYQFINHIEGRSSTPEKQLKEEDFAKLFFDRAENFSVSSTNYRPQAWPPDLKVVRNPKTIQDMKNDLKGNFNPEVLLRYAEQLKMPDVGAKEAVIPLFEQADNPILFWKTDELVTAPPAALKEVRDLAEKLYKFDRAREDLVLPAAKQVAQALIKSAGDYDPVVAAEAKRLGKDRIELRQVAPLMPPDLFSGRRDYEPFSLSKTDFPNQRDDMAAQILSLPNLQKPITTVPADPEMKKKDPGNPALDALNKELFEECKALIKEQKETKKAGQPTAQFVQVLTNKPRSMYYVAVMTYPPQPSGFDFNQAFQRSLFKGQEPDPLLDRAQANAGKSFRQSLMQQMRRQLNYEPEANVSEEIKSFDKGGSD